MRWGVIVLASLSLAIATQAIAADPAPTDPSNTATTKPAKKPAAKPAVAKPDPVKPDPTKPAPKPLVAKPAKPAPPVQHVEKPPPDPCLIRTNCKFSPPVDAGNEEGGGKLAVLPARVLDLKDKDGVACRAEAGPNVYWLLHGDPAKPTSRQLIMQECITADIDPPAIAIQANLVSISHINPGTVQNGFTGIYSLSPLRLTNREECAITTTSETPSFREMSLDMENLHGEGSALIQIGDAEHRRMKAEYGCQDKKAKLHWLVLPRVVADAGAMKAANGTLGSCATVMKADGKHGYLVHGAPDGADKAEIKIVAIGPRSFLVQIVDPGHQQGERDRLDFFVSETGKLALDAESEKQIAQFGVDIDGDKIGAGGGVKVTHWSAKTASGHDATMLHVVLPGPGLQPAVTVSYSEGSGKSVRRVVASSALLRGKASSLGEMFDFTPYTSCAIKNGALDIIDWGHVHAPITVGDPP